MTKEGMEFINADPDQVIEYLQNRRVEQLEVSPSKLFIKSEGKYLKLQNTGSGKEYPLRKSFLYKLLKWHSFPLQMLQKLSIDTVAGICNDYLLQMNNDTVRIKIEGEDALTITSCRYAELTDLEIINRLSDLKLKNISRNDFMLRIISREKYKIEPVPGNLFGIGLSIINSETGFRALRVSHYLLRYICSNGAVSKINKQQGRRIHYKHKDNDLNKFLREQISLAAEKQKTLKESITALAEKKVNKEEVLITKIQNILGKDKIKINAEMNSFEFFNLVTERAKKYELSKRVYIEELAGGMI